jgi:hypothetical protein
MKYFIAIFSLIAFIGIATLVVQFLPSKIPTANNTSVAALNTPIPIQPKVIVEPGTHSSVPLNIIQAQNSNASFAPVLGEVAPSVSGNTQTGSRVAATTETGSKSQSKKNANDLEKICTDDWYKKYDFGFYLKSEGDMPGPDTSVPTGKYQEIASRTDGFSVSLPPDLPGTKHVSFLPELSPNVRNLYDLSRHSIMGNFLLTTSKVNELCNTVDFKGTVANSMVNTFLGDDYYTADLNDAVGTTDSQGRIIKPVSYQDLSGRLKPVINNYSWPGYVRLYTMTDGTYTLLLHTTTYKNNTLLGIYYLATITSDEDARFVRENPASFYADFVNRVFRFQ